MEEDEHTAGLVTEVVPVELDFLDSDASTNASSTENILLVVTFWDAHAGTTMFSGICNGYLQTYSAS